MSRGGAHAQPRIADLGAVEVEHLLGLSTGLPLVKLRVLDRNDRPIAVGQIEPADARRIATHLMECAARAEYEADLANEARDVAGMPDHLIADLLGLVRGGELRRHQQGDTTT